MTIRLLRRNRIDGNAGEIVEVSPARAAFLITYGLGEMVCEREQTQIQDNATQPETPEDEKPMETPEDIIPREIPEDDGEKETPEAQSEKPKTKTARKGK